MRRRPSSWKSNETRREEFIHAAIEIWGKECQEGASLIDVGAGLCPYREVVEKAGITYFSHDFSLYTPDKSQEGLQNSAWKYPQHDYTCEILEIPVEIKFDFVLCTEVLEHVPDPVRALEKISQLLKPGGQVLITVPEFSLEHQSPFWFQPGLSKNWFNHWSPKFSLEIIRMTRSGDYSDVMIQEISRMLSYKKWLRLRMRLAILLTSFLASTLPKSLLNSTSFGIHYIAEKSGNQSI